MCGVFGIHAPGRDVARLAYFALYALQHRGQESAGHRRLRRPPRAHGARHGPRRAGLRRGQAAGAPGRAAIGHARYSTTGSAHWMNSQPIVAHRPGRTVALGHNGNLTNTNELRAELQEQRRASSARRPTPRSSARSSPNHPGTLAEGAVHAMERIRGAFSAVVLSEDTLLAFRDPDGIRPLVLGDLDGSPGRRLGDAGARHHRRDRGARARAGRAADLRLAGLARRSRPCRARRRETMCVFEHIYFARPDAQMDGQTLHAERERMGEQLAAEAPAEADVVIPVPDSGTPAAQGYARASGLPFARRADQEPLRRAHVHPARPGAARARRAAQVQPAAARDRGQAAGRRRRLDRARLDDAQDRRDAARRGRARGAPARLGAADHLALLLRRRHGGQGRADRRRARRSTRSATQLGADSLAYLSLEGLQLAIERPADRFCRACLTGNYPVAVPEAAGASCASRASRVRRMSAREPLTYAQAGVSLQAADAVVDRLRRAVASTRTPRVLGDLGGFAGLVSAGGYRDPVLVAGTDGVGTKLMLQRETGRLRDSGIDLVAMCVNDVLTCGAEPVLFLDYIAVGRLDPERVADVVEGVADGCRQAGCALLGGETAELPDMYGADDLDLAGFALGIVERDGIVDGARVARRRRA